jgi:hypothetical protein
MKSYSKDLVNHISVSVAIPEMFYDFRVFSKKNDYVKEEKELNEEISKYKEINEFYLNGNEITLWHFERIVKIYKELSLKGNLKSDLSEILERLKNNHFEKAELFVKEIKDLIMDEKIIFSEIYDEEDYVSLNLEGFVEENEFDWEEFGECVSIVTITLDNLLTTYLINPSSRKIKLNIINFENAIEKLNLKENEIEKFKYKLNDYSLYFSHKTSLKLSKERGSSSDIKESIFPNDDDLFNWNLLKTEIKLNGLRNEIEICLNELIKIIEKTEVLEKEEINPELDYYFSKPKKLPMIEEEEMAPIIKGMQGAKEMCPICFSLNIGYISGCMRCNDCGWSACSLS